MVELKPECDVFANTGCAAGQKCTVGTQNGTPRNLCFADRAITVGEGAVCMSVADGSGRTGDNCAPGLICLDFPGDGPHCRKPCFVRAHCAGGQACVLTTPTSTQHDDRRRHALPARVRQRRRLRSRRADRLHRRAPLLAVAARRRRPRRHLPHVARHAAWRATRATQQAGAVLARLPLRRLRLLPSLLLLRCARRRRHRRRRQIAPRAKARAGASASPDRSTESAEPSKCARSSCENMGAPRSSPSKNCPSRTPGRGEVRVRVAAVAMNHLDIWVRNGLPHLKLEYPFRLGADVAGTVDELGPGVRGVAVGDEVVVNPGHSCGRCRECLSGRDNLCRWFRLMGEDIVRAATASRSWCRRRTSCRSRSRSRSPTPPRCRRRS